MTTFQFKTNINCGGCESSVQPYLEELNGIESWHVDTEDKNKILTVKTEDLSEEDIINKVREAGFEAKPYQRGIFDKLLR